MSANADENRVMLRRQILQGHIPPDALVEHKPDSEFFPELQLLVEHILRQPVRGDSISENAAGLSMSLIHGYLMTQTRQIERRGKARRPRADNGNRPAGRGFFLLDQFGPHILFASHLVHGIGEVPVNLALSDRFVQGIPATTHLAVEMTDTTHGSRKWIVPERQFKRVLDPSLLQKGEITGNVHVERAGVFAQRLEEAFTNPGLTAFFVNMHEIFVTEILECGEYRIRRGLAQTAKRRVSYRESNTFEIVEIFTTRPSFRNVGENPEHLGESFPAGRALAARFGRGKTDKVPGYVHHAVFLVHHHHAARTHDRAEGVEGFIVHGRSEFARRDASSGRTAGLNGANFIQGAGTLPHSIHNLVQGCPERKFHKAGVVNLADQGKNLGPRTLFGTD